MNQAQENLKEILLQSLRNHVVIVVFTKLSDGSRREMRCTLKEDLLPEDPHGKLPDGTDGNKKPMQYRNPHVVRVYDLDKKGYRSFSMETILTAEIEGTGILALN